MTRRISSTDETPASESRTPSSRSVACPPRPRRRRSPRSSRLDQPADAAVDRHHLVQRDAAAVAGAAALGAAHRAVERRLARGLDARARLLRVVGSYGLAAVRAEPPRETLRDDAVDRRREQVGSTPMSCRRAIDAAALCVCSVVSTRWPVIAAWIAICAVSSSRISPTRTRRGRRAGSCAARARRSGRS